MGVPQHDQGAQLVLVGSGEAGRPPIRELVCEVQGLLRQAVPRWGHCAAPKRVIQRTRVRLVRQWNGAALLRLLPRTRLYSLPPVCVLVDADRDELFLNVCRACTTSSRARRTNNRLQSTQIWNPEIPIQWMDTALSSATAAPSILALNIYLTTRVRRLRAGLLEIGSSTSEH
jgi:hypothetical protein